MGDKRFLIEQSHKSIPQFAIGSEFRSKEPDGTIVRYRVTEVQIGTRSRRVYGIPLDEQQDALPIGNTDDAHPEAHG